MRFPVMLEHVWRETVQRLRPHMKLADDADEADRQVELLLQELRPQVERELQEQQAVAPAAAPAAGGGDSAGEDTAGKFRVASEALCQLLCDHVRRLGSIAYGTLYY